MTKKELHKIAPILSKIPTKVTGFQVPENYFDSLEDLVVAKLKAQTFATDKDNRIPENYFDNLEGNVLSKLKSKSKVVSIKKAIKYIVPLAIAASFLLIFMLNNNASSPSFESITSLEIEEFIENGSINFDAESLTLVFPDVELDDTNFVSSISDNEVLDYLGENEIEELLFEN